MIAYKGERVRRIVLKEEKEKKRFFNLPEEDEIYFEIEKKEKEEKAQVRKRVFKELEKKYKTDN